MKKLLLLLCLPVMVIAQSAQPSKEYTLTFNKSRELLYYGKFKEALPFLLKLDSTDKTNPNINYLIGVCHVAIGDDLEQGISRLTFSSGFVSTSYRSGLASERSAPIYNWYYLGVGYTFLNDCDKAAECFSHFKTFISDPGDSYVADADRKVLECKAIKDSLSKLTDNRKPDRIPVTIETKDEVESRNRPVQEKKETEKVVKVDPRLNMKTRTLIYTTKSPLYAVQVGAYDKLLPDNEFKNLKNVNSFIDKSGKVRYVVGHCVMRSQAENLRKAVIEAGYKDAFIVDVNTEEKFSQEVVHASKPSGRKEYRVQLGVFRNEIPEELSKIYITIENVKETQEGELTILTSGSFKDHESALRYREQMISKGVKGAFVVVFINGKRQSLASVN
jgi:hypothetical protein